MRIADKMAFDQVDRNLAKNRSQMSELQNQAASQKKVTKPSDDPLSAARILSSKVDLQGNRQFAKNLNYAKSFIEYTDQSLADLSDVIMRAKELAISQANDPSSSESSRSSVALEIAQLHSQTVQIGNRKLGDRFIFGGFKTQGAPFNVDGKYSGDTGEMMIHIDKESFLPLNIPGSRVFQGEGILADGATVPTTDQPRSVQQLREQLENAAEKKRGPDPKMLEIQEKLDLRGPASVHEEIAEDTNQGSDLFLSLRNLEISLRTNDKSGIQDSLDILDKALNQIIVARAEIGSRSSLVEKTLATMEKTKVDNQANISQLEDADIFSTVSDINKTESTLQASLQTSSKLVQKSLMDFLR